MSRIEALVYVVIPVGLLSAFFTVALLFLIIQSYRAINIKIMSAKLKDLQRRFLRQLIFQAGIPMFLVCIPAFELIYTFSYEVFGYICKLKVILQ